MIRLLAAEVAVPARCELAGGPVWAAARGLLHWVDILPGRVHAFDPVTGVHTWFEAGDPVGTVGLTRGGGLVLALVDTFALSGPGGEDLRRLGGFSVDRSVVRFNDGKPDPGGNFCAGTMAWQETGGPPCSLYRLSPGELHPRRPGRAAAGWPHLRLPPRGGRTGAILVRCLT